MENKKRYWFYSLPVKLIILFVLIASAIVAGISGSWIIFGLNNGMTLKETFNQVEYERSEAIAEYMNDESDRLLELIEAGEVTAIANIGGNTEAWLVNDDEETNVLFYVKNVTAGTVYTNIEEWGALDLAGVTEDYDDQFSASDTLSCYYVADNTVTEDTGDVISSKAAASTVTYMITYLDNDVWLMLTGQADCEQYQIFVGVNTNYPVKGSVAYAYHQLYRTYGEETTVWFLDEMPVTRLCFPALAVMAAMLVLIGVQTGHYAGNREIHTKQIDRTPIEIWFVTDAILAFCTLVAAVRAYSWVGSGFYWTGNGYYSMSTQNMPQMMAMSAFAVALGALTLAKMINLYGRRIKARTLGSSVIRGFCRFVAEIIRARSECTKTILYYVLVIGVNVIVTLFAGSMFWWNYAEGVGGILLLVLAALDIVLLRFLVKNERGRHAVVAGIREISEGNLDYQIDTAGMSGQNREMADEVNRMRDGMKLAVQTQLKSERLKTDLIANVSHDIKTPLTSIINYVDILDKENLQDPKLAGYVDILVRKSARLKQLTDDLIEVSKISSGNITLDMQEINLKQLIKQTNGEFEEKFEARHLQLVCNLAEEDLRIRADGRRMYRVLENLYNNCAKYAMPYSRVYVDGTSEGGVVTFSIKNMSESPLNMTADELMERFVRGDSSRTTEGSGLGLEIARNLTAMQHGKFDIFLDGDLFKVIIVFGLKPEDKETDTEVSGQMKKDLQGGQSLKPGHKIVVGEGQKSDRLKRKLPIRIRLKNPLVIEKTDDEGGNRDTLSEDEL